jgi:predicted SAM-dependent methyltransferase
MKRLNLGCGSRFHPEWVNLDLVPANPLVRACDLSKGIPFPDGSFAVVYHSHVLEHFRREKALWFLRECHRVLELGGIVRVAVPDLEQIARIYLRALEGALREEGDWPHHYEWIMLELYDQVVREESGGAMGRYLRKHPIPNEAFVRGRVGGEGRRTCEVPRSDPVQRDHGLERLRRLAARVRRIPRRIRTAMLKALLGQEGCAMLEIARFRERGEIHRWMYDRYSLGKLLREAGFQDPKPLGAAESQIPGWAGYNLDTEPDGTVYKPDSLYMEAVKR